MEQLEFPIHLLIPITMIMSFIIVFVTIPTILKIAYAKKLVDIPNGRKSHKTPIPRLGGIAIAFSFIFTYTFFADMFSYAYIPFLTSAFAIIFSIGIKDDIIPTSASIKLMGQILASVIIVSLGGVRIDEIQGILDFPLDTGWSVTISIFIFVFMLNGFNLIDGIDGLAAITGIVTLTSFSILFYIDGLYHIPMLSGALIGGLVAFIYYNMYCIRKKIFMGDTGSLLIGFIVSIVSISFLKFNNQYVGVEPHKYLINSAPAIAVAILIVPIIDTIRIFFLRILRGNSPFTPDKNHIHHRMLALGMGHHRISFTIGIVNIFFVVLAYCLRDLGTWLLLAIIIPLGFIFAATPSWILYYKKRSVFKRYKAIEALKVY